VLGTSGGEERLSCHSGWTTKWRPVTVIHNFWVHSRGLWGPTVLQMTQGSLSKKQSQRWRSENEARSNRQRLCAHRGRDH